MPQKVKLFLEKAGYKKERRRIGDNPNPCPVYLGLQPLPVEQSQTSYL